MTTANHTATIGFFDGVHLGHQYLLRQLCACAHERGTHSLVLSFDQHPRKVLHSNFQPLLLTDNPEKIALLQQQNVDAVELLHFTPSMAALTAEEFMRNVLIREWNITTLLLGYDHRFGSDQISDFAHYQSIGQKLGIEVIQQSQYSHATLHVSSTSIRQAIANNQLKQATQLLGRNYSITGKVVGGYRIGRKIGFPTANIQTTNPHKLIPPTGVYNVLVSLQGENHKGMLNIGTRPMIDNPEATTSIEVHILDFDREIYDAYITIDFISKIREEQKFDSLDLLIAQLNKDREFVREN